MLRRKVAIAAWSAALTLVAGSAAPATAARTSAPHDLYVYGHSWTTGYALPDPSQAYPHLVAADLGETLHNRGRNGPMVHQVADYLLGVGDGTGTWQAGTPGDVLVQAVANTARDLGVNALALTTTRNALRVMVATFSASRRIEDDDPSHHYRGVWHTNRLSHVSGGALHTTTRNDSYVQFRAVGGEYLVLRGVSGTGITVRLSDRTAGHTVTRIRTGHQVHPLYSRSGIPLLYRVPRTMARHTIRLTKESGRGSLMFDTRLPQERDPDEVVLLKEPYLLDYSLSTAHPHGTDHVLDVFNAVLDQVAAEFPHTVVVDPNARGWDKHTMLLTASTHPNEAGSRFLADLIDRALRAARAG
ncbi:hypothetical protein KRR39_11160 [Nocardioides panacis]|uniref:SGNH/GDSL hydrolase family protein n=1 Tax=Nocardioides panacis TaxID=2849501 RepID=A0A975T2J7_9ACTN|nr:hypothetical protein [Nocardioides panacis]QWZ10227.1 hypothetical protein KRR39_11160 [Nocardioides panacis]